MRPGWRASRRCASAPRPVRHETHRCCGSLLTQRIALQPPRRPSASRGPTCGAPSRSPSSAACLSTRCAFILAWLCADQRARILRATLTRQLFRHAQGEGEVCFQPEVDPECPEWPTRPFFNFGADGYRKIYVRASGAVRCAPSSQLCALVGGQPFRRLCADRRARHRRARLDRASLRARRWRAGV
jgi:hypothetical protein